MDIKITINTDNAAFEDDREGEVARILSEVAKRFASGSYDGGKVRDVNGNTVGAVSVMDRE